MRCTKQTCEQIITSGNDYLAALKGNHGNFFKAIKQQFSSESHGNIVEAGHGRVERRSVSILRTLDNLPAAAEWAGLTSIIRVTSYRHLRNGKYLMIKKPQTRYYISSLNETVEQLAQRIRDYWHVENKVHDVRDVTQCVAGDPPRGEDSARIRVHPLPNLFADFS